MREDDKPIGGRGDDQGDEPTLEQHWPMQDFWPFVIKRIGIVGAVAPLLFFVVGIFLWCFSSSPLSFLAPSLPEHILHALVELMVAVVGGVLSFIIAIIAAAIVAFVADLVLRGFDYETLIVGGLVGGAIGLLAMVYLLCVTDADGFYSRIALGMIAATVIGQIGGAWGAWDSQGKRWASLETEPSFVDESERNPTFQFSIRQLLVMTTCCALLLTVLKLMGILTVNLLYYFGIWLAVQAVGLVIIKSVNNTLQRRLLSAREQRE